MKKYIKLLFFFLLFFLLNGCEQKLEFDSIIKKLQQKQKVAQSSKSSIGKDILSKNEKEKIKKEQKIDLPELINPMDEKIKQKIQKEKKIIKEFVKQSNSPLEKKIEILKDKIKDKKDKSNLDKSNSLKSTNNDKKTIAFKKQKNQEKTQKKQIQKDDTLLVNKEPINDIKKITDLDLTTIKGKKIHLKFLEDGIKFNFNKIVILDIFATWCPPCIKSIAHLNQIQKKYKKNIQIIGILMDEKIKKENILKFIKKHAIIYPVTYSKNNFVLVNTWGGVSGYPTIIIFDKNGKYFAHYNGAPPIEMLLSDIKRLLRKK